MINNTPASAGDLRDEGLISVLGRSTEGKAKQPTPVFFTGESHGQRSLADYSPWGHKQLDTAVTTWHTRRVALRIK